MRCQFCANSKQVKSVQNHFFEFKFAFPNDDTVDQMQYIGALLISYTSVVNRIDSVVDKFVLDLARATKIELDVRLIVCALKRTI